MIKNKNILPEARVKLIGGGIKRKSLFEEVISLKNLFLSWGEFKKGKNKKKDVIEFKCDFKNKIFELYNELKRKKYHHSAYYSFCVKDPKLRHIHKATVRDRILHHAVFRILYPIFDKSFIFDSYSCRINKGTHKAVNRLQYFANKVSKNNTKDCFILKCDIKKYFDSVNHDILTSLIRDKIKDKNIMWLIDVIINSYSTFSIIGIPLGNITSQLFANIYLNELDKYIKQELKIKYYIRYCDDFLILSTNRNYLKNLICKVGDYLDKKLNLSLHPNKITITKYRQGIDFLGYIIFPYHRVLRVKTKKRMIRNIQQRLLCYNKGEITKESFNQTVKSYAGVLKHCDSHKIKIKNIELLSCK